MIFKNSSTTDLHVRCQEVDDAFRYRKEKLNPAPCLELFRRAVEEREDQAWNAFIAIYSRQVKSWLKGGFSCLSSMWEEDELVLVVFERFAKALTPERYRQKLPWTLLQVMAYLQRTATSLRDEVCRKELQRRWTTSLNLLSEIIPHPDDDIEKMMLWDSILQELEDNKERLVAREKFLDGLPPRDIFAQHPDIFEGVNEVYMILHRIRARFSRRFQKDGK